MTQWRSGQISSTKVVSNLYGKQSGKETRGLVSILSWPLCQKMHRTTASVGRHPLRQFVFAIAQLDANLKALLKEELSAQAMVEADAVCQPLAILNAGTGLEASQGEGRSLVSLRRDKAV